MSLRRPAVLAVVGLLFAVACTEGRPGGGPSPPPTSAPSSSAPVGDAGPPVRGTAKPNIVLFLTDDLDARSIEFMPKLKSLLADQGTSFSNYLVNVSLCCPSRVSMLRGQYAHNTGVLANRPPAGGFEGFHAKGLEQSTVATWLHDGGYRTGLIGKYLNGYPRTVAPTYVPPGWDEFASPVRGNPYSEFNYTLNENGRLVSHGRAPEDYLGDVIGANAIAFVQQASADHTPFFLYVSTYAPHGPATPAPRHEDLFADAKAPRDPSFGEQDVSDKPAWVRALPPLGPVRQRQIDELYRKRLASLHAVDEMVAGVVQALQESGALDNTYLLFTSDNGFHLGQHRQVSGKQAPYEEDIRVPLIVRGPGVPRGRTLDQLVGNIDLAPTFADWARAQVPENVDGRSLAPLLSPNPTLAAAWRDAFLIEHGQPGPEEASGGNGVLEPADGPAAAQPGNRGIPPFIAIRTARHIYVEYTTGERELYDLAADPFQLDNAIVTANPTLVTSLADRLRQLVRCAGPTCRSP